MRVLLVILSLALPAGAFANTGLDQLQQTIANELPIHGFDDVDVTELSTAQLHHIHMLLFSGRSAAQIRGNIGAILGDSLLKTIFK